MSSPITTTSASNTRAADPIPLYSEDYCVAWAQSLAEFLPAIKDRAREALLRLSGWGHWRTMIDGCTDDEIPMLTEIPSEQRLATLAAHRDILIHEFGVKPAYANYFLWMNPVDAHEVCTIAKAPQGAIYAEGEKPSNKLPALLADLDRANRSMIVGTDESLDRVFNLTPLDVYMSMFDFLGWGFAPSGQGGSLVSVAPPIAHLGQLQDDELGDVPVFASGVTSNPEITHDSVLRMLVSLVVKRQAALNTPAIMLHSEPMVKTMGGVQISCFGLIVNGGRAWPLLLGANGLAFSDVLVEVLTSFRTPSKTMEDPNHDLAVRFAQARESQTHDGKAPGNERTISINIGGDGWGTIALSRS